MLRPANAELGIRTGNYVDAEKSEVPQATARPAHRKSAITRFIKRGGKLWIRIFPDKPFTKKPAETRMGKGKGPPEHWVAVVKPGRVMFEMSGVDLASAKEAMELAAHKLPIRTKFVSRAEEL